MLEELVLECLVAGIVAGAVEQCSILGIVFGDRFDLLVVVGPGQCGQSVWVHFAAAWIQFGAVVLRQLRAERVDCDDDGTTVGLKLHGIFPMTKKSENMFDRLMWSFLAS